jgi:transposase-like protein
LQAILGEEAGGLSAANVVRLKKIWEGEFAAWQKRDLTGKRYVYVWADGIYFNVRLEPERPCLLVLIGATAEGHKELIALHDGQRESKLSWQAVLQDLKAPGLMVDPLLAIGDGNLRFWAALREECPSTLEQRCWVHKTANILDKLPKTLQPDAKSLPQRLYLSATKNAALHAYDQFIHRYEAKYPAAFECLAKDQEVLFTFYDFPAEHWRHIRTTNPIESTFITVRHRTRQTKGCGSRIATLTMAFMLTREAEKRWQRLHGYRRLDQRIAGAVFVDGELKNAA